MTPLCRIRAAGASIAGALAALSGSIALLLRDICVQVLPVHAGYRGAGRRRAQHVQRARQVACVPEVHCAISTACRQAGVVLAHADRSNGCASAKGDVLPRAPPVVQHQPAVVAAGIEEAKLERDPGHGGHAALVLPCVCLCQPAGSRIPDHDSASTASGRQQRLPRCRGQAGNGLAGRWHKMRYVPQVGAGVQRQVSAAAGCHRKVLVLRVVCHRCHRPRRRCLQCLARLLGN